MLGHYIYYFLPFPKVHLQMRSREAPSSSWPWREEVSGMGFQTSFFFVPHALHQERSRGPESEAAPLKPSIHTDVCNSGLIEETEKFGFVAFRNFKV